MTSIGVVNMYGHQKNFHYLIEALSNLGYTSHIIDGFDTTAVYDYISKSPIHIWIFSGGDHIVIEKESPQVSLKLLQLKDKRFMFICYSMESILHQMGYPIKKRATHKKEYFNQTISSQVKHVLFKDMTAFRVKFWRNHHWYFSSKDIVKPVELIASYNGEAMIATYKNAVLIQFHPERSADGKKLLWNFIHL